jgi:hypothetical protein
MTIRVGIITPVLARQSKYRRLGKSRRDQGPGTAVMVSIFPAERAGEASSPPAAGEPR